MSNSVDVFLFTSWSLIIFLLGASTAIIYIDRPEPTEICSGVDANINIANLKGE